MSCGINDTVGRGDVSVRKSAPINPTQDEASGSHTVCVRISFSVNESVIDCLPRSNCTDCVTVAGGSRTDSILHGALSGVDDIFLAIGGVKFHIMGLYDADEEAVL